MSGWDDDEDFWPFTGPPMRPRRGAGLALPTVGRYKREHSNSEDGMATTPERAAKVESL